MTNSAIMIDNDLNMERSTSELVAKVPQVTLLFWIIKILATTLGETGGDAGWVKRLRTAKVAVT